MFASLEKFLDEMPAEMTSSLVMVISYFGKDRSGCVDLPQRLPLSRYGW
jgi:hypothetical protein